MLQDEVMLLTALPQVMGNELQVGREIHGGGLTAMRAREAGGPHVLAICVT